METLCSAKISFILMARTHRWSLDSSSTRWFFLTSKLFYSSKISWMFRNNVLETLLFITWFSLISDWSSFWRHLRQPRYWMGHSSRYFPLQESVECLRSFQQVPHTPRENKASQGKSFTRIHPNKRWTHWSSLCRIRGNWFRVECCVFIAAVEKNCSEIARSCLKRFPALTSKVF